MTQVVMLQRQTPEQSSALMGSEAKNPLPINGYGSWEDVAGLSWIFLEDSDFS